MISLSIIRSQKIPLAINKETVTELVKRKTFAHSRHARTKLCPEAAAKKNGKTINFPCPPLIKPCPKFTRKLHPIVHFLPHRRGVQKEELSPRPNG